MPDKSVYGHGDWPMFVPPERGSEDWTLYEAISAPIIVGECDCHALCVCEEENET